MTVRQPRFRISREQLRDAMRLNAISSRQTADEMAAMFGGCDDELYPFMPAGEGQVFRDWVDFTERVCRPIVEAEDDEVALQAALALFRKANPHFIATCMVIAAERVARFEMAPAERAP